MRKGDFARARKERNEYFARRERKRERVKCPVLTGFKKQAKV